MTHTGEKPHNCTKCDFSCIMSGNLATHMRSVHAGEKSIQMWPVGPLLNAMIVARHFSLILQFLG